VNRPIEANYKYLKGFARCDGPQSLIIASPVPFFAPFPPLLHWHTSGKINQTCLEMADSPLNLLTGDTTKQQKRQCEFRTRGLEKPHPHQKAVIQTKHSLASPQLHFRKENDRWNEIDKATVDKSPTSAKLTGAYSSIQHCLEEQQQRRMHQIPSLVKIAPQESERSLFSSIHETSSENSFSQRPCGRRPVRKTERSAEAFSPVLDDGRVKPPRFSSMALNKPFLKILAERHRTSLCGERSFTLTQKNSCESESSASPRSTLPSPPFPDSRLKNVASAFPEIMDLPPMEERKPSPRPPARPQRAPSNDFPVIEVCPGLSVPLRGKDATKAAVADNFCTNLACFGCERRLHCIANARYTICPRCRIICPIEEDSFQGELVQDRWGLGLGMMDEEFFQMQIEIATDRSSEVFREENSNLI